MKKVFNYLNNNYNLNISKNVIYNAYTEIGNILINFINIEYSPNLLGDENQTNKY